MVPERLGSVRDEFGEAINYHAIMNREYNSRTTGLRCLRLISTYLISDVGLVQAVSRYPQLEELEISFCSFSSELIGFVGQACPQLKTFKLAQRQWTSLVRFEKDREALVISKHMRQLRRLQLYGNTLTGIGLLAIIDNCPYLEYLDIRGCLKLYLDENLKKKCARIKEFRYSNDNVDNGPSFFDYDENCY